MKSQLESICDYLRLLRRGTFIFGSSDSNRRGLTLAALTKAAVCTSIRTEWDPNCSCPGCSTISSSFTHPEVQTIASEHFDLQMALAYSYPSKVVCFPEVHLLSKDRQMQLLIWLEIYSNTHCILMTTSSVNSMLPTIISRSFVYTEVPTTSIDPEIRERASALLMKLFLGDLRIQDVLTPEEGTLLARALQVLMVEELENRMRKGSRGAYTCSNQELQTLLKIVGRYLENPKTHNLPLLLRSFQMLALMNVR